MCFDGYLKNQTWHSVESEKEVLNFQWKLCNVSPQHISFGTICKKICKFHPQSWKKNIGLCLLYQRQKVCYLNATHCIIFIFKIPKLRINHNNLGKTLNIAPQQLHTTEVILKVFLWGRLSILKENWKGIKFFS